jgi:hypothetical protein
LKDHDFLKGGKRLPWFMQACRMRRLREKKQEILTESETSEEDLSESDMASPDSWDSDLEATFLDLSSEELDSGDELDSLHSGD